MKQRLKYLITSKLINKIVSTNNCESELSREEILALVVADMMLDIGVNYETNN